MEQQKQQTGWLSIILLLTFSISIVASLFFKEQWLWMDEVLSYLFISDPSIAHMNNALVSSMDQNPFVFPNVYWAVGHTISQSPQFLRAVSIVIFAATLALFYRYTTRFIGTAITNFVLITAIVAFTYLNLTLSTQIRGYSLFLLITFGYFVVLHRLITSPNRVGPLLLFCLMGLLLVFIHSFGLFFAATSGAFFTVLLIWSKDRRYLFVLAAHVLLPLAWLLIWYPSFVIQTDAGKPHSWIPEPTFMSFFSTVGELAPTISSALEHKSAFSFLSILRFVAVVGLWLYIALPRLKNGFRTIVGDRAFTFYLLAGFLYITTIGIALLVSVGYAPIFISRYLWPDHLLVIYQLMYAFYFFQPRWQVNIGSPSLIIKLLPLYILLLGGFLFYQNKKVALFPRGILSYIPQLDKRYPIFVETAHYFLPIWFHDKTIKVRYVLDWESAVKKNNILQATVAYKALQSTREKYHVDGILTAQEFNQTQFPHFYVVDEQAVYQIERFIENGQVRIIRDIPVDIKGHRILECEFNSKPTVNQHQLTIN